MAIDESFIGKRYPEAKFEIGKQKIKEFIFATKGDEEKFTDICPPTFPVAYGAELLEAVLYDTVLDLDLRKLVHGEQEFFYHKAVKAGDSITSSAEIVKIFKKGAHDFVVFKVDSKNQSGELVTESIATFVIRGGNGKDFSLQEKILMKLASLQSTNYDKKLADAKKLMQLDDYCATDISTATCYEQADGSFEMKVLVDKYLPQRYAGAGGDFNAIHLDDDLGKNSGLGGYILHGMATMAFGANLAMVKKEAGSIKHYKVRFSDIVKPLDVLTFKGKYSKAMQEFAFTAHNQNGKEVLNNCFVEFN